MLRKPSCLLVLVLLCGAGQAGVSVADGPPFIGRLPQGTVELVGITYHPEMVGITYHPPTKQSRWWQPDGSAAHLDLIPPQSRNRYKLFANENAVAFLVRYENLPADASRPAWGISPGPQRGIRVTGARHGPEILSWIITARLSQTTRSLACRAAHLIKRPTARLALPRAHGRR